MNVNTYRMFKTDWDTFGMPQGTTNFTGLDGFIAAEASPDSLTLSGMLEAYKAMFPESEQEPGQEPEDRPAITFKPGDRLICVARTNTMTGRSLTGEIGTVIYSTKVAPGGRKLDERVYVIEFDDYVGGHDGDTNGKEGHCWALPASHLQRVDRVEYKVESVSQGSYGRKITLSHEPNYASAIRTSTNNTFKEVPMNGCQTVCGSQPLRRLSTMAKRMFDADTKALIEVGVLDEALRLDNAGLAVEMLTNVFKKELAAEAKARLKEQKADQAK